VYATLARYYDILHRSVTADIPLVLRLAAEAPGPILELGCGSGRLMGPLAEAGFAVWGLDSAPEMLALARARAAALPDGHGAGVNLIQGDMTAFALSLRFGLILIAYNTLMHLAPSEMARALRLARQHLAPGGRVYLDLESPYGFDSLPDDGALVVEQSVYLPERDARLIHYSRTRVDRAEQIAWVTTVLEESPAAGGPAARHVAEAAFYYLWPHECELLLNRAGLALVALYGDYDEQPFGEDSRRMIAVGAGRDARPINPARR
jgi:SAM-dependent methyltransferase